MRFSEASEFFSSAISSIVPPIPARWGQGKCAASISILTVDTMSGHNDALLSAPLSPTEAGRSDGVALGYRVGKPRDRITANSRGGKY